MDKILAVKDETGSQNRKFLVRWEGYGDEHDSWQPRNNLPPAVVNEFLIANNLYDFEWPGGRCPHCDRPCKSQHGVKIHARKCWQRPTTQNFTGTCAEDKVRQLNLEKAQHVRDHLKCEEVTLKNVFIFKYLGSLFAADGDQKQDLKRRIALASSRMGELRHVFNSGIALRTKMKVYKTAVCSLLTYG